MSLWVQFPVLAMRGQTARLCRLVGHGLLAALLWWGGPAMGEDKERARETPALSPQAWSYRGEAGPDHWGNLGFATCQVGRKQSPVDFGSGRRTVSADLDFQYRSALIRLQNSGHTIRFLHEPGSFLHYGGKRYDLTEFQFHAPSEHTLAGRTFAMEVQFFHRSEDGRLLILAVMVLEGEGSVNNSVETLFSALPMMPDLELLGNMAIQVEDLLPRERAAYFYVGSLTTPPCTEGVTWFVFKEPVHWPAPLIARLTGLYSRNTRPIQRMLVDKFSDAKPRKGDSPRKPGTETRSPR